MDRLRPAFVWAVWAGMTVFAGLFVAWYGGRAPIQDDFDQLHLRLERPFPSLALLWKPHNEHRMVLPKIATWVTARVLGPKLRTQMALNLALVSALAGGLIVAAQRLRGFTRVTDAFLPLTLLTVGQSENLLWAIQVNFFLPVALQGTALALVATAGESLSIRRALGVGLCTAGLPLCGVPGVLTGSALAAWLAFAGWSAARAGRGWAAAAAVVSALVTGGFAAAHVVGHAPMPHSVEPQADLAAARYAVRMLGAAWGPVVEQVGPSPASPWPSILGSATLLLAGGTAARLLTAARDPRHRLAATGLLAMMIALLALAGGIGYGRAGLSQGGVINRYITLMVPLLCLCYLAWVRAGPPRLARVVTFGMFVLAVAFAWPNASTGMAVGRYQRTVHAFLERDVQLGLPASALADRYAWFLLPGLPDILGPRLELLKQHRFAPFHRLAAEPRVREVSASWRVESFPAAGPDGWSRADDLQHVFLAVTVSAPEPTTGVRVRYSVTGEPGRVSSEAYWRRPRPDGSVLPITVLNVLTPGEGLERRLWLGAGVNRITLVVRGPCAAVRIEEVTAFVAE